MASYTLILHYQDKAVWGYTKYIRQFNYLTLKADGTFDWAGSAFRHGTATLSFDGEEPVEHKITYCDVEVNPDGTTRGTYVVNGIVSAVEEFTAAVTAQSAKPDVIWHDLTEENINTLLTE